jgi:Ca2+-binding EF-hand superfamily protein
MHRIAALFVLFPCMALAQTLPATHVHSGLDATSARTRLERDTRRQYGPRFEAAAMPAAPAIEYFPGLRLPGQKEDLARPAPAIRIVKPAFRLPEQNLGIADTQDILFFAEARLVRLRVHLKATGEPLAARWTGQLRKYFEFLDRDGDGVLNRYEAEFAFSNPGVLQMMQSGFAYQRPDDAARTFADIDVDGDGKLSFDEFAFYYSPTAARVITALPNPNRDVYADALTDEMFKLFDTDKDGKLSRSEINAIEKLLTTLDADEDECLSAIELVPNLFNGRVPLPRVATDPQQAPMMALRPGSIPDAVLEMILTRYDKDKNLRLSKAENPFGDEVFAALDLNKDDNITLAELMAWKDMPPDLELEMTLGDKPDQCGIRILPRADGKPAPLATGFRATGPGSALLTVGKQSIQLNCFSPTASYGQAQRTNFLQFPDPGKGYVTEKDIGGPQFQAIRVLFDMIDRDGDGKMTRAEFDAFEKLQQSFTRLPLNLVYAAPTPSLFQILDANGDGRISVREARQAWDRLIAMEPAAKDFITRAALQPQGALRFGRANEVFAFTTATTYSQQPVRQTSRGPLWFRKFDRNGDGEVSRNEFPGSQADFDRIDTNHDGYITLEEAEAADKVMRVRK